MGGKDNVVLVVFLALAAPFLAVGVEGLSRDLWNIHAWVCLALGLALLLVGYLWREGVIKPKIDENSALYKQWKRRMNQLIHASPVIGILVGGFLFVGCVAWMLAQQRQANEDIMADLKQYVLPRHLTEAQIKTISTYLKGFPPQTATVIALANSEEASAYRYDFQTALREGGWTITGGTDSAVVPAGLHWRETQFGFEQSKGAKGPRSFELFMEAMREVRIQIDGSGDTGDGGASPPNTDLIISIGHRRMDDGIQVFEEQRRKQYEQWLAEHAHDNQ